MDKNLISANRQHFFRVKGISFLNDWKWARHSRKWKNYWEMLLRNA